MPNLDPLPCDGRIPKGSELCRRVTNLLRGKEAADAVIALSDVYTGSGDFENASDAKLKMQDWVGNEPRFYPHVALYDFEAWLLPYWPAIQELAGSNRAVPAIHPETVNHAHPCSRFGGSLSHRYPGEEICETARCATHTPQQRPRGSRSVLPRIEVISRHNLDARW